jgi:hypothetical protein
VNLSLHMGSGARMVGYGAVVPLVKLMNRTQSDRLKANCAAAVANMAGGAGRDATEESGVSSVGGEGGAAASTGTVPTAISTAISTTMVAQGVIEPLVYLCMSSKNVRVLGNAAGALVNLARDKKCVGAIVKVLFIIIYHARYTRCTPYTIHHAHHTPYTMHTIHHTPCTPYTIHHAHRTLNTLIIPPYTHTLHREGGRSAATSGAVQGGR